MEIHVWHGNGQYDLYEDDGETTAFEKGAYAVTRMEAKYENQVQQFVLSTAVDPRGILSKERQIYVKFRDVENAKVYVNGCYAGELKERKKEDIRIMLSHEPVTIELRDVSVMKNRPFEENRISLLTRIQAGNNWKNRHLKGKKNKFPVYVQNALDELEVLL